MSRSRITLMVVTTLAIVASGSAWLWAQAPGPQPSFGQLVASPPNFVFKTPTTVTFTIRIDTSTVNPSTVELLRVDVQGKRLATVGQMNDKGKSGDAVSDDRIFTSRITLNEPAIGRLYFRVTAAFRGSIRNSQSSLIAIDVDPFQLPPDPGEAGKVTVEGIDSDKDGIRDDVQRYIALTQIDNPGTRAALRQLAEMNQTFILGAEGSVESVLAIDERLARSLSCLGSVIGAVDALRVSKALRAETLDTKARSIAYVTADAKLSGHFFPTLKLSSTDCDFDPANPPTN
jgi:hypothetical protein